MPITATEAVQRMMDEFDITADEAVFRLGETVQQLASDEDDEADFGEVTMDEILETALDFYGGMRDQEMVPVLLGILDPETMEFEDGDD